MTTTNALLLVWGSLALSAVSAMLFVHRHPFLAVASTIASIVILMSCALGVRAAPPVGNWAHKDADRARFEKDRAECLETASRLSAQAPADMRDDARMLLHQDINIRCMQQKGYRLIIRRPNQTGT